jgi:hypothetical protein
VETERINPATHTGNASTEAVGRAVASCLATGGIYLLLARSFKQLSPAGDVSGTCDTHLSEAYTDPRDRAALYGARPANNLRSGKIRSSPSPITKREPEAFFLPRPNLPGITFYFNSIVPEASEAVLEPEQRRSKRVILDVPIVVRGEAEDTHSFQEGTLTLNVSAHGALVVLGTKVAVGQKVALMNLKNWDEREATVVRVGPARAGFARVGIQFIQPAPEFWSVSSGPYDRNLS